MKGGEGRRVVGFFWTWLTTKLACGSLATRALAVASSRCVRPGFLSLPSSPKSLPLATRLPSISSRLPPKVPFASNEPLALQ